MPIGRILLTYAGLGAALWALRGATPALRIAGLRGAWFAGWLAVTIQAASGAGLDLGVALAPAAWTVALARGWRWATIGVVALAIEAAHRVGAGAAVAQVISCALGAGLAGAMVKRAHLPLRITAHWASFIGTFAMLLPKALAEAMPPTREPQVLAAAFLALAGASLAITATRAFAKAGGTPEPLDPPLRLVNEGPYRYIRHPIQLAEILFVAAGLAWFPNRAVALYAAGFSLALKVPLRMLEEAKLAARFGAAYDAWRARVPAYVPRLRL